MKTSPEGINWQETPKNPGLSQERGSMNRIRFCQCVDSLGKGLNHQGTHKPKKNNENEGA